MPLISVRHLALLVLSTSCFASPGFGQPPAADLRVRVSDTLGDPIAGASAVVDADTRGSGRAVITGADGIAIVPVPELPLPLVLRVSAPGFAEHIEALQPGSAAFDVRLEPAARTSRSP
jgi:hypothetical protein